MKGFTYTWAQVEHLSADDVMERYRAQLPASFDTNRDTVDCWSCGEPIAPRCGILVTLNGWEDPILFVHSPCLTVEEEKRKHEREMRDQLGEP